MGGGGGGGGSDGEEGCFAVARGGTRGAPEAAIAAAVWGWGCLGGGSFFVGAIKGHGDSTNGDRGGLAGAINQGGNQYIM